MGATAPPPPTLDALARAALGKTLTNVLVKHDDIGRSTQAPREVYRLSIDKPSESSPWEARRAVDTLAKCHACGDVAAFRELLLRVFPYREDTFGFSTWRDTMPALALVIDASDGALETAEQFCAYDESAMSDVLIPPIDLLVSITMETPVTLDFLQRVSALVQRLTSRNSKFRVTMVELGLGALQLDDERALRVTSRLCDTLLCRNASLRTWNVSCLVAKGGVAERDDSGDDERRADCDGVKSPLALGELFQTICRVGCPRLPEPVVVSGCDEIRDEDCNRLTVEISCRAHPRIAAALWSAIAWSRGYAILAIKHTFDSREERNDADEAIGIKYLAAAVLLQQSDVQRIQWERPSVLGSEAVAIISVQTAVRSGASLAGALWDRDWSVSRHGRVFETASLNEAIARRFGWLVHDPGHGDWIDVFVPGFAQCSVKRESWNRLHRPVDVDTTTTQVLKMNLQICTLSDDAPTHIASLLSLVKSSLTALTISGVQIFATGLLAVVESCPRLRHLKVDKVEVLGDVASTNESFVSSTKLEKLELMIANKATSSETFDVVFAAVLRAIGAHLTHVHIESPIDRNELYTRTVSSIGSFGHSFRALVESSPRLEELTLQRLDIGSVGSLVGAYQTNATKVSSLQLVECPIDSSSLLAFAMALRSATCPSARRLRRLYIKHTSHRREYREQLQGLDPSSVRGFLEALRVNQSLTYLFLLAQQPTTDVQAANDVATAFDTFRAEDRARYESRCRERSAMVLASALQARKWPWNEEIVRQILQFVPTDRRAIGVRFE